MEFVRQHGKFDSPIACTAMICGVSYEEAFEHFAGVASPSKILTGHILKALRRFGRPPQTDRVQHLKGLALSDLGRDALLWSYGFQTITRFDHWAVWDHGAQAVRDPLVGPHELLPRSYLAVA